MVSGGFYTTDNQPTGLFITEGKTIRNFISNTLFNGIFALRQDKEALINTTLPDGLLHMAIQTGPILFRNGEAMKLTIRDDEEARRVIVGITKKGIVIFLAFYDPENPWSGPKLADTPSVLVNISSRLNLRDALNLDGGSASAFIRSDLSLEELTTVGSFFCIN